MPDTTCAAMLRPNNKASSVSSLGASPRYITRQNAAARYEVSIRHLDGLIRDGIIPAVRLGKRCLRIPVAKADAVVESLETGGDV